MKKLLKNKKGVSPVVSAVIMMLVVMIGMSALFAFFVNYAKDFQLGSGSSVLESMTVEDVWFKGEPNRVDVWVYNIGKVNFTITAIYVNDTIAAFLTPSSLPIGVGKHGSITVTPSFSIEEGDVCRFKLVTSRGTSFEGEYQW
jgi:FlaG/FlaF family flagellin (archaellin)